MQPTAFRFVTDTATLLVCDPERLKHRLADDADWWCWPPEEQVRELNAGNAAFVDLGADGAYDVQVVLEPVTDPDIELKLACQSGHFFIGAGEEATCRSGEPECLRGGTFVTVKVGSVLVTMKRNSGSNMRIGVIPFPGASTNGFAQPLVLK